jgi:eukaryotic-like serine/threonine-protein kinase
MAQVYLARSFGVAGFEKRLVIKRIRPELEDNPRFVSMFINEAKIGVQLDHPNVVQVYELGRVDGSHYIAMEHLHGRDLTRLKKQLAPLDERMELPLAAWVVAEVCRGLSHAHTRSGGGLTGIVHRDVSPHNIIATFSGQVKLVDFGIARLMHNEAAAHETVRPGPGGGKYAYMSPEQAHGDVLDQRTDIFSAGIVLWELIVGHRLYQHPDPAEKLRRVQNAVVPHPREEGVAIDDGLWDIVAKALARLPNERYQRCALLEEDLRAWLFEGRHRVEPAALAELLARFFPDAAKRTDEVFGLDHMLADVERLDRPRSLEGTGDPDVSPRDSGLPGRLRPSKGERKQVAVVFIDVDGLTELSERVEPEVLFRRHFHLLRWTRRIVDRFGGIIQRVVDDQMVLLFGVPRTRVDDLTRALECALEIQRRSDQLHQALGTTVSLAMGVHAGEVTVHMARHRVRYDARGDTTRLARRLSAVADHGEVLTSRAVVERVGGSFKTVPGPPIPSRGGKAPLTSFHVQSRRAGLRITGTGEWIRRGDELTEIRKALVHMSQGERVDLIMVGEIGAGKSRLVREIREIASRRGIPFYGARCTAVDTHPLRSTLLALISDITGGDAQSLAQLGLPRSDVHLLEGLLGRRPDQKLPADVTRLVASTLTCLALNSPLILALEDIHQLREHRPLSALMERVEGPVFFLLTTAGSCPSALRDNVTELPLGPFPADAQTRLVKDVLEVDDIQPEITDLLARTCEGNPLYIQEMVKHLVHEGRIEVQGRTAKLSGEAPGKKMPASLAQLIMARIDALDPGSKGILQLAAIAGSTFDSQVLAEAAGVDDTAPLMADLSDNGLIQRVAGKDTQWAFGSELVREAAKRGSLGVQRRDYHRMYANALQTVHADDLTDVLPSLAQHYAHGGMYLEAARHAFKAGEAAEERQDLQGALRVYTDGLDWISKVQRTADDFDAIVQGEALLHLRAGVVDLLLGEIGAGEHQLHIALDVAGDTGLPWIETRAHLELGRSYLQRGRYVMAGAHLGQVRALLRIEQDRDLELEALEALAILAHEQGRNEEAESLWSQSLVLAEGDDAALARCKLGLANRHLRAGHHEQAAPLLNEALAHTVTAKDRILEGRVLNNIGLLHSWAGRHDEALQFYRHALEVRQGIGYSRGVVINHHNIGDVHFSRKDWARAWVAFSRSRELAERMGWERGVLLNQVYLAYIDCLRGDGEMVSLQLAIRQAEDLGDAEIATTGRWLAARWWQEHNDLPKARGILAEAILQANGQGLTAMVTLLEDMLSGLSPEG